MSKTPAVPKPRQPVTPRVLALLICLTACASFMIVGRSRAGDTSATKPAKIRPEQDPAQPRASARPRAFAALPVPLQRPEETPLTVGFIYVGTTDDVGYNQAHAEGAAQLKKMPGVAVVEMESVAESKDCEQAMESLINDKHASLIFATSFGYFKPHVLEMAHKYPDVTFLHAGGYVRDSDPPNVGSYFAYIDEVEYLSGIVAGLTSKANKLGFVAAKPITPVLRDINAFALGARSVNAKATVTVIFTGDWFDPIRESTAVNLLADHGIDVVTGHIDSPKALIATAEKRNIYSCGFHADGTAVAPKGYLTGAQWNWGPMYKTFVDDCRAGKPMPKNYMGSLREGAVQLSPYGPAVPEEATKAVDLVLEAMKQGKFRIYKGPIKDNRGNVVVPEGKSFDDEDPELWRMSYLVEGVVGTTR